MVRGRSPGALNSFQLPPSHEGEPRHRCSRACGLAFQLPPSHEGELSNALKIVAEDLFQLPPSHEGERTCSMRARKSMSISTPALA